MNDTPTPETDAETMRDEYDHIDSDFGPFDASITVPADFARQLERERDELAACLASEKITRNHIVERAAETERERDEARAIIETLAEALRECREDSAELLGERDWWQNEARLDYQKRYQETRDNVTRADAALSAALTRTAKNKFEQ
jgi:hypothetical protein